MNFRSDNEAPILEEIINTEKKLFVCIKYKGEK